MDNKEYYMGEALKEAKRAYKKLEIPVGAIIVKDGVIIAKAHNLKEMKFDATQHAEINVIKKASKKISWNCRNNKGKSSRSGIYRRFGKSGTCCCRK